MDSKKFLDTYLGGNKNVSTLTYEALAEMLTDYAKALQLQQTGVKQSVCKHEFISSVAYKGAKICTKCNKYQ
mgnify:CR=1 FL=1